MRSFNKLSAIRARGFCVGLISLLVCTDIAAEPEFFGHIGTSLTVNEVYEYAPTSNSYLRLDEAAANNAVSMGANPGGDWSSFTLIGDGFYTSSSAPVGAALSVGEAYTNVTAHLGKLDNPPPGGYALS